jgi:hypothetical protein
MTTPISHTPEFVEERFGESINAREQAGLHSLPGGVSWFTWTKWVSSGP